jgi:hypothetical protein
LGVDAKSNHAGGEGCGVSYEAVGMAMDQLASVAHAAGFAMADAENDVGARLDAGAPADVYDAMNQDDVKLASTLGSQFSGPAPKVVLGDTFTRWQGTSRPLPVADVQASRTGGIFGWLPGFSWRADGR